jgi:hypothetical protein
MKNPLLGKRVSRGLLPHRDCRATLAGDEALTSSPVALDDAYLWKETIILQKPDYVPTHELLPATRTRFPARYSPFRVPGFQRTPE